MSIEGAFGASMVLGMIAGGYADAAGDIKSLPDVCNQVDDAKKALADAKIKWKKIASGVAQSKEYITAFLHSLATATSNANEATKFYHNAWEGQQFAITVFIFIYIFSIISIFLIIHYSFFGKIYELIVGTSSK